MSSIYDKNIEEFTKTAYNMVYNFKEILDNTKNVDEYVKEENGILYFKHSDRFMQLTSCYPDSEIELYETDIPYDRDNLIIILGIANVEMIKSIYNKSTEETRIQIIEPNIYVMKYVLEHYDISWMMEKDSIRIAFGDEKDILDHLNNMPGWELLSYNAIPIVNPNYYMYTDALKKYLAKIREILAFKILSLGNDIEDRLLIFECVYKNIENMFYSNSLNEIVGKFEGYPAFIVASGPSLEKNIKELTKVNNKGLIIACDASNRVCLENGIIPDMMASIERSVETYEYFYKDKHIDKDTVLVGPSSLWSNIFTEFKGKKIMTSRLAKGIDRWIQDFFPNIVYLNQGLSCAHTALATVVCAGCNPIVLVGQDLAYTDDKQHSDIVHEDFEDDNTMIDESDLVMTKDIYGNDIKTCKTYNIFREWFETFIAMYSNIDVIDATEGGAYIRGSKVKTLKETIDKYCKKELPYKLCDILSDIYVSDDDKIKKYRELLLFTKKERKNVMLVKNRCREHNKLIQSFVNKIKNDEDDNPTLADLLEVVKKGEKAVRFLLKNNINIFNFYEAAIAHISLKMMHVGREINVNNILKKLILQSKMMTSFEEISNVVYSSYTDMVNYLEDKLSQEEKVAKS